LAESPAHRAADTTGAPGYDGHSAS